MFEIDEVALIPSGLGGVLPALILAEHEDTFQVRCLHDEFYPMHLLSVKKCDVKKHQGKLSEKVLKNLTKARNL